MAWVAALMPSPSSLHWLTSHFIQMKVLPATGLDFSGSVTGIFVGSFFASSVAVWAAVTWSLPPPPELALALADDDAPPPDELLLLLPPQAASTEEKVMTVTPSSTALVVSRFLCNTCVPFRPLSQVHRCVAVAITALPHGRDQPVMTLRPVRR